MAKSFARATSAERDVGDLSSVHADANVSTRLDQLFSEQAMLDGNRPAILHRGEIVDYASLDARSNQIAHYLRSLRLAGPTLIGVCMPRSPQLISVILGILKAGAGYVPLDPAYPTDRLNFMLADSRASMVLIAGEAPSLEFEGAVVDLDSISEQIDRQPDDAVPQAGTASDVAYVIYTSGSTGKPKGVLLAHTAVGLVKWFQESFDAADIARVAACTSICFDPSILEIFATLCTGGLVILKQNAIEPFEAGELPTMLSGPPSVMSELARMGTIPDSVRVINVGGEAVTRGLVSKLYASSCADRIYNHYGPTETTTCATVALVEREATDDPAIGYPIAGARVYVLGPTLEPLADGEIGEIYIAGPTVALGYLGDPETTKARFVADPFVSGERMYKTGDLGVFQPNGELLFKGRVDNQVKLRGFRIELGEVEAALMRLADIQQAVALVQSDELGRKRLVAYVSSDKQLSFSQIRRQLSTWLPEHMLPSELVMMDSLPVGPTGKLDRAALSGAHGNAVAPTGGEGAFLSVNEKLIAEVFAEHLKLPRVGPEDDFYDLGGDSLLSIAVAVQLEELLAQTIPPIMLNQLSTPRALALGIAALAPVDRSVLWPLWTPSEGPRIFCTPDLHGRPLSYTTLARWLSPAAWLIGLSPGPSTAQMIAEPNLDELSRAYFEAIRSVQPSGPYVISGFSLGGVQAFDLARLIEEAGERVLLILVDAPNPAARRPLKHKLRWFSRDVRKMVAGKEWKRLVSPFRRLRTWTPVLRRTFGAVGAHEVPSFISAGDRDIARSFLQAAFGYVPKPFSGSSVLIRCTEPDRLLRLMDVDGMLGWSQLLSGPCELTHVPATHMQMMREPFVSQVDEAIRAALANFFASEDHNGAEEDWTPGRIVGPQHS